MAAACSLPPPIAPSYPPLPLCPQRFKMSVLRSDAEVRRSHFIEVQALYSCGRQSWVRDWVELWLESEPR